MENLTFYHTWLPFIYLYGVGGIAFLIGMYLITRTRALSLDKIHHIENNHGITAIDFYTRKIF